MKRLCLILLGLSCSLIATNGASAQSCQATPERHAEELHGFITGKNRFIKTVGGKWSFTLEPASSGWDIRLRDKNWIDLTQITPPFRGTPNPREVYGWHFRNKANTAKNTGDVNAPQHLRLFQFSQSLSGTGGFRPSNGAVEPDPNEGRGWLKIRDMGLADLEPGERARMNYLQFNACLTWPRTTEEALAERDRLSPIFLEEERETMFGCGLDANKYELSAWVMPRIQSGDFDGDDAIDTAVPIIRKSDGRKGVALCRAGTWVSVVGYGNAAKQPLKPDYYSLAQYLNKVEFWEIRTGENGQDMLVIGQTEKSETTVEWTGKSFTTRLLAHFVEP